MMEHTCMMCVWMTYVVKLSMQASLLSLHKHVSPFLSEVVLCLKATQYGLKHP